MVFTKYLFVEDRPMISHGKDIKIFSGNSNKALAENICRHIGIRLGDSSVTHFSDGEISVSLYETVRGSDVFIVQSTCGPVNNNLMELLIMIDAARRASAGRITAVIPYFGYARQDRKAKARDPISAKLVANLITSAGADRVLTLDLHAPQIQGFFDIPVDHLVAAPLFSDYYIKMFGEGNEDVIVVSPDVGSVARARNFAHRMGLGLAIVDKRRERANQSEVMNIIGDVRGKHVILFDDMVDTAGSLCGAVKAIVEIGGAKDIYACATHGVMSGPALQRLKESYIKEMVFADSIPYPCSEKIDKIKYLSVAPMFAEAIERIYEEVSISTLFK
jgi:ribose-phosphate pyrophosphokinase